MTNAALGAGLLAASSGMTVAQDSSTIAGFDQTKTDIDPNAPWQPVSDRKIKMGLVGFGLCQFGLQFGLQNHPNVELIAVSDLIPERCAAMAKAAKCEKTYPSLEEMLKDKSIEAIFLGTDAPSHARQSLDVLRHGKHVATAVPALFGIDQLDLAEELLETVNKTGLIYTMFETSAYHDALYAMRKIYRAGGFGKLIYSEGEYFHYGAAPYDSYKGWRIGIPPMYYPTHSTAYYCAVADGSFTEVSCLGNRNAVLSHFQPENNAYKNPFGSEIALLRTSEGGMSRMAVTWDTAGIGGETGRVSGQKGSMWGGNYRDIRGRDIFNTDEPVKSVIWKKPQLPPGVSAGGHGGSHGYLGNDFVEAILLNRRPTVDIVMALNMTVPGVIAHKSALKEGELMKVPQFVRKS